MNASSLRIKKYLIVIISILFITLLVLISLIIREKYNQKKVDDKVARGRTELDERKIEVWKQKLELDALMSAKEEQKKQANVASGKISLIEEQKKQQQKKELDAMMNKIPSVNEAAQETTVSKQKAELDTLINN